MKKISILLAALMCLCLCGCGSEKAACAAPAEKEAMQFGLMTDKTEFPVEEIFAAPPFDPAECTVWTANCEDYVAMRVNPWDGQIIAKISNGEEMMLLGWDEQCAYVRYGDSEGYVPDDSIKPSDADYFAKALDVVIPTDTYSYEQMMADIDVLAERYPDLVETEIAGQSELGRDIPVIRIGDVNAEKHVFLQGAIHGREHMTAWCLMAMADYWLDNGILEYGNICWHIMPMVNPDGVIISQTGELTEEQQELYKTDIPTGYFPKDIEKYAAQWKANGKGTDINRNFPAGWEYIIDFRRPSAAYFRGETPFSTAEAKILRDYSLSYDFDVTLSYHSSGSIIYWQYGTKQPVNDLSRELGKAVAAVTGYLRVGGSGVVGGGYKDWAINTLEIPSLTIEIGSGDSPLDERELYSIFARNYMVLPAVAGWLAG